jgi:hypothetical protein
VVRFLQVFVPHDFVMPGRVMLRKIVRDVEFSGGPDKIELLLFDSVFHPPVAHIKRF